MYADLTTRNPSFLKRFSHSKRFDMALELLAIDRNDKVLDYGTGDGFMLAKLLSANPQLVVGYEPTENAYQELQEATSKIADKRVKITNYVNHLEPQSFDKVCCLEVLEHLTEENQRKALLDIRSALKDAGFVVASVPIEIGLSGLLKNFARWILRQQHRNSTVVNILKSFIGWKIDRGNDAFILSHIGFDYRNLEKLFTFVGFGVKQRRFSPLQGLGGFLNSQVFFVLQKSKANNVLD